MTPFLAATTTDRPGLAELLANLPWGWILLGALVTLAYKLGEARWRPYTYCRRCDGRGKFARKDGKAWRRCRRCKGSGEKIRFGRRVWNRIAKVHRDAA